MERIDAARLETDLVYRYEYLCKFVGFTEEDVAIIQKYGSTLSGLVPAIVDAVYVKLFCFDITKKVFLKRNLNFTGKLAESLEKLDLKNDQIMFRKDMLSRYLVKLVTAPFDEKMVKYLDYVGKIHTPAMKNSITVDYIHCGALLGYVEDILLANIAKLDIDESEKTKLSRAFNKLLWIQNDFFARYYINSSDKKEEKKDTGSGWINYFSYGLIAGLSIAFITLKMNV